MESGNTVKLDWVKMTIPAEDNVTDRKFREEMKENSNIYKDYIIELNLQLSYQPDRD